MTAVYAFVDETEDISTHTLRGERDNACLWCSTLCNKFQLTRSVGSVTTDCIKINVSAEISTHTLRGERDVLIPSQRKRKGISTHTLRGERDATVIFLFLQQRRISTHTLRGERDLTRQSNLL